MDRPQWRFYYADGSTFDSTEGDIHDAPSRGVALIVQTDEDSGRDIVSGLDFYFWRVEEEKWCGGDLIGLVDQFSELSRDRAALKVGRTMTKKRWKELRERALVDPDFPKPSRPPEQVIRTSAAHRGLWSGEQGDDR